MVVDKNTVSFKSEKKDKCQLKDGCQESFVKELELSWPSMEVIKLKEGKGYSKKSWKCKIIRNGKDSNQSSR